VVGFINAGSPTSSFSLKKISRIEDNCADMIYIFQKLR
jgi:hypothetical protein